MARVRTHLDLSRCTPAAFLFYRSVFGGPFNGLGHRPADVPAAPGQLRRPEADDLAQALS